MMHQRMVLALRSQIASGLLLFSTIIALSPQAQAVADEKERSGDTSNPAGERVHRAAELAERYQGKVSRERLDWHWLEGGKAWYSVRVNGGGLDYHWVDSAVGLRRPLYEASKIAIALSKAMNQEVDC